jgi:prophage regulatory protein
MPLKKQATVCKDLETSRNGLAKLSAKDPTFPRPIKLGNTKQSPVYYDADELNAWIESKKAARG